MSVTTASDSGAPQAAASAAVTEAGRRTHAVVLVMLLALAALGAIKLGASVGIMLDPLEKEWGEALIHDHAARIVRGEPLYQRFGETFLSVATYTPLYYYLVAALQVPFGPALWPGRLVSILSTMALAWMVGSVAYRRTGSAQAGWFGALLFLVLGVPPGPAPTWSGLYKEDMLALLLSFGAVWVVEPKVTPRRAVLAGVLAALAFLTKQTMIISAMALIPWLLLRRDYANAGRFSAACAVVGVGTFAAFEVATGALVQNTLVANVNPFRGVLFVLLAYVFALTIGPLVVGAALHVAARARASGLAALDDPVVFYWAAGLFLLASTIAKWGTNVNHWMPLGLASSILLTQSVWRGLLPKGSPMRFAGHVGLILLAFNLLLILSHVSVQQAQAIRKGFRPPPGYGQEVTALLGQVRSAPGMPLADPPDVLTLAGRPIATEPWAMSLAYFERIWPFDPAPLVRAICAGEVSMLVLGYTIESGGPTMILPRWPPPVLEALRATMVLDGTAAGRYVYTWRQPAAGSACG